MGLELASTRNTSSGSKIVYFCGNHLEINGDEFRERWENGDRRYMLYCGTEFVLDTQYRLDVCKASRINSFRKAGYINDSDTLILAKQNCRIVVDPANKIISIEAIKNITRFEEFFCEYGDLYVL